MNFPPIEILSSVFSSLSIDELFSVLLVSKNWHDEALYELRKRNLSNEVLLDLCFHLKIRKVEIYLKYLQVSEESLKHVIATLFLGYWDGFLLHVKRKERVLVVSDNCSLEDKTLFGTLDENFFLGRPELVLILREKLFRKKVDRVEIFFRGKRYIACPSFIQKIASGALREGSLVGDYKYLLALLSEKREELNPKLKIRFRDRSLRIFPLYDYFRLVWKHRHQGTEEYMVKQNPRHLDYAQMATDTMVGKSFHLERTSYDEEGKHLGLGLIRSSWRNEKAIAKFFYIERLSTKKIKALTGRFYD